MSFFISISGLIGAGKTTLAKALGDVMNLPVFYEEVISNDYLADFYKNMDKYAFPLQIHLLNRRFKQQQQIIWNDHGGVQDRTIYEDKIFARMLMKQGHITQRDYDTYSELFNNMANFMRKPNLIVHLDVSPEVSLDRIKKRARNSETGISLDYLKRLRDEYNLFLEEISKVIPVLVIDWNEFKSAEEIAEKVKLEWKKMSTIKKI